MATRYSENGQKYKCPWCSCEYSASTMSMITLTCGHQFCEKCMHGSQSVRSSERQVIYCPICKSLNNIKLRASKDIDVKETFNHKFRPTGLMEEVCTPSLQLREEQYKPHQHLEVIHEKKQQQHQFMKSLKMQAQTNGSTWNKGENGNGNIDGDYEALIMEETAEPFSSHICVHCMKNDGTFTYCLTCTDTLCYSCSKLHRCDTVNQHHMSLSSAHFNKDLSVMMDHQLPPQQCQSPGPTTSAIVPQMLLLQQISPREDSIPNLTQQAKPYKQRGTHQFNHGYPQYKNTSEQSSSFYGPQTTLKNCLNRSHSKFNSAGTFGQIQQNSPNHISKPNNKYNSLVNNHIGQPNKSSDGRRAVRKSNSPTSSSESHDDLNGSFESIKDHEYSGRNRSNSQEMDEVFFNNRNQLSSLGQADRNDSCHTWRKTSKEEVDFSYQKKLAISRGLNLTLQLPNAQPRQIHGTFASSETKYDTNEKSIGNSLFSVLGMDMTARDNIPSLSPLGTSSHNGQQQKSQVHLHQQQQQKYHQNHQPSNVLQHYKQQLTAPLPTSEMLQPSHQHLYQETHHLQQLNGEQIVHQKFQQVPGFNRSFEQLSSQSDQSQMPAYPALTSQMASPDIPPYKTVSSHVTNMTEAVQTGIKFSQAEINFMSESAKGRESESCLIHSEPILLHCVPCHSNICSKCCMPGSEHEQHEVSYVKEKLEIQRAKMKECLTKQRELREKMACLMEDLKMDEMILEESQNAALEEVRKCANKCFMAVIHRRDKIISAIERIGPAKCEIIQRQRQQLELALADLVFKIDTLEKKLDSNSGVVESEEDYKDFFQFQELYEDLAQPHENNNITFMPPDKFFYNYLGSMGCIMSCSSAQFSEVRSTALLYAIKDVEADFLILAKNHAKQQHSIGFEEFKVTIIKPNSTKLRIFPTDNQDGTYTFMLKPDWIGVFYVIIKLRGQSVDGSPFRVISRLPRTYEMGIADPAYVYSDNYRKEKDQFAKAWGIACHRGLGRIYITDRGNNRVQVFQIANGHEIGPHLFNFGHTGTGDGEFSKPAGIDVHEVLNRVVVVDKDNHRVQVFDGDGHFLFKFGTPPPLDGPTYQSGELNYPWDVSFKQDGHLAVTDTRARRIQVFSAEGHFRKMYPSPELHRNVRTKLFDQPRGICYDKDGNLFVTDFNSHKLVVIKADLKSHRCYGGDRQMSREIEFLRPQGLVVDELGNVIVADSKNMRLQVIDRDQFDKTFLKIATHEKNPSPAATTPTSQPLDIEKNYLNQAISFSLKAKAQYGPLSFDAKERLVSLCIAPDGYLLAMYEQSVFEPYSDEAVQRAGMKLKMAPKDLDEKTSGKILATQHSQGSSQMFFRKGSSVGHKVQAQSNSSMIELVKNQVWGY